MVAEGKPWLDFRVALSASQDVASCILLTQVPPSPPVLECIEPSCGIDEPCISQVSAGTNEA